MSPERWRRIKEIAFEAMDMPSDERRGFLESAAGDDPDLLLNVEKLLAADEKAGDSLADAIAAAAAAVEAPVGEGRAILHYRVDEKLGVGGMGEVWKAEDTQLRRTVALKFLPIQASGEDEIHARLIREAQAAASLDHSNICPVYGIHEARGRTFLAMAYVDGPSLADKLRDRPLPLEEAVRIAIEIAAGLQAAHEKGVVHRDVKPHNVMLTSKGPVKITDFGLASVAGRTRLTKRDVTLGTPAYMAPEQIEGREVDRRADVWALGVALYEMLTQRRPFDADYGQAIAYRILHEEPEPVTAIRSGIPLDVDRILMKALAKPVDERYQHADELAADLRLLQRSLGSKREQKAALTPVRRRMRLVGYVAALALLVAVATLAWRRAANESPSPMRLEPLTSYEGSERYPDFSPDGEQVAFAWNGPEGENWDIYVKRVGSESATRLTTDAAPEGAPAWSPDGRRIAFVRGYAMERCEIVIIPAAGGPVTTLAALEAVDDGAFGLSQLKPAWLPDSSGLIIRDWAEDGSGSTALFELFLDDRARVQITRPSEHRSDDFSPAISPDGRTLAFFRQTERGSPPTVFLQNLREDYLPAGQPESVADVLAISLAWSPDGRGLVVDERLHFWARRLLRIPLASPKSREVLEIAGGGADNPVVSARRGRLAYRHIETETDIAALRLDPGGEVWRPESFRSSTRTEYQPQYSPDAKLLVFESDRSGPHGVWISETDGSNARPFFVNEGWQGGSARWSPDGTRIAFEDGRNVYVMNVAGGDRLPVTDDPHVNWCPTWSRDSEWIYFHSNRTGRFEVYRVSAAGGVQQQVTTTGGGVALESTDRRYLYFLRAIGNQALFNGLHDLVRMPIQGGEESTILEGVLARNYAVGRDGIYFMTREGPDEYSIRYLDLATGRIDVLWTLPPGQGGFIGLAVSPDEKSILYATFSQSIGDLMLIENFR